MGYVIVAIVAVAVAVFAMQNTVPVDVEFVIWRIDQVPVAAVVLASLGAGLVIAGIPLWFQLWRARRRARLAEAEARRETAAAEAARAALAARELQRPAPGTSALQSRPGEQPAGGRAPELGPHDRI